MGFLFGIQWERGLKIAIESWKTTGEAAVLLKSWNPGSVSVEGAALTHVLHLEKELGPKPETSTQKPKQIPTVHP